jgi:hypothetical protein
MCLLLFVVAFVHLPRYRLTNSLSVYSINLNSMIGRYHLKQPMVYVVVVLSIIACCLQPVVGQCDDLIQLNLQLKWCVHVIHRILSCCLLPIISLYLQRSDGHDDDDHSY